MQCLWKFNIKVGRLIVGASYNNKRIRKYVRSHRGPLGGDLAMRRRKPDLLLVLAVIIGFGVVATSYALDLGEQPPMVQSKL